MEISYLANIYHRPKINIDYSSTIKEYKAPSTYIDHNNS